MTPLVWALIALVLGLGLVVLEFFIPSGGLLGFLAFAALTTSLVLAFTHSTTAGLAFVVTILIALPTIVIVGLNILPHTPIGRRVFLSAPDADDVLPDVDTWGGLYKLVGQIGQAKSPMRPSGAILIEGKSVDAVSSGMPIEEGQLVRVIEVRANRVVVVPVDDDELTSEQKAEDDLARPIDSIGLNPFEDPLA